MFKIKFMFQNLEVFKWSQKNDIQEVENIYFKALLTIKAHA